MEATLKNAFGIWHSTPANTGSDTIDASASEAGAIIYGDAMNTAFLLARLQELGIETGLNALSGSQVFKWLETYGSNYNLSSITGHSGAWTEQDTINYIIDHAVELGYEVRTRFGSNTGYETEYYLVDLDGNIRNLKGELVSGISLDALDSRSGGNDIITGSDYSDVIFGQEGNDTIIGGGGEDHLFGGTGNDLLMGDGDSTTLSSITSALGIASGSGVDAVYSAVKSATDSQLKAVVQAVEGLEGDDNDFLYGGHGNDILFGMGGNDYLDGSSGSDIIFGGAGNDLIVYDTADYLVHGGSGIDFMISDNTTLTMDTLLSGDGTSSPKVTSMEVLITGDNALSLTSISQLAEDYGITLGTDAAGKETLTLSDAWTRQNKLHPFV